MHKLVVTIALLAPLNAAADTATAIAAAGDHNCAITTDAALLCWGSNYSGQLGDGTTADHSTPQAVTGLAEGVSAVATGTSHTCAISGDGQLQCWGANGDGRLGDGTTAQSSTPVDVDGLSSGVISVAAGEFHTCAVTDVGGVKCWGKNDKGQLGTGTTSFDPTLTPVDVVGLSAGVVAVAAGSWHTCALLATGGVKCWGYNYWGQLGNGTNEDVPLPVDVVGLVGTTKIAAGATYNCAITDIPSTGGLQCWGYNGLGQLGDGTTDDRYTPVGVIGHSSGVTDVSGSVNHTCAVTDAGRLQCWGSNLYGQLGDGTTASRSTPGDVTGLTSGVTAVASGGLHTCAITDYGTLCWGSNSDDQLGNELGASSTPVAVVPEPALVFSLATGAALLAALARRRRRSCVPQR
jgi:alpha-tubulin suppressor-like RCC1 family protein